MYDDNIKSLRLCADECEEDCEGCAYYKNGCMPKMMRDAADALESSDKNCAYLEDRVAELIAENEELKQEIEWLEQFGK